MRPGLLRALIVPGVIVLAAGGMYAKSLYDEYWYDQVTGSHIERLRPGAPAVRLAWEDVTELRERFLLQRLELRPAAGPVLQVEYELECYPELRQLIAERAAHARHRRWL
jgi:hypothetical protein